MENETKFTWLNADSKKFLVDGGYVLPGQTVEDRIDVICNKAEEILGIPGFAAKFKANVAKGWYSLATPVLSNFGTNRGLPISCFGSYIDDSTQSITDAIAEVAIMSKEGGGTSAYFGALRGRGAPIRDNGKSFGAVHFMKWFDTTINTISQGSTRRGQITVWLNIDHPDIDEFLTIRDEGHPIQDLSFGVTVPDYWLRELEAGNRERAETWVKVLECRARKAYPFILFSDNVDKGKPDVYKDKDMRISHSNLCTEIALANSVEESFVCCLSSMNVATYDEWKNDPEAVELLTFFLDAVLTEFIEKAKSVKYMDRAVRFAENQRALGIGLLGYHTYLQSKRLPFASHFARRLNVEIAKNVQTKAWAASKRLADLYGEPELLKGYGRRNVTLTAIAPTKSTSFIFGKVSEGIEPIKDNYHIKDLAKGKFTIRNPWLKKCLEEYGQDTPAVWDSIMKKFGSVQHLDFLSDFDKDVFRTLAEIPPMELIIQASARQNFVDQAQSLNLWVHPKAPTKQINALYLEAWKSGVKTLYYQYSRNAAQEFANNLLECSACEA